MLSRDKNHEQYPADPFTQTPKRGLAIQNSPGASVTNCFFYNKVNNTFDADARGIYVSYGTTPGVVGAGVQASVFYGNVYENVATAMEIDGVNNPALDCVVFPHHATPGSGAMVLPLNASNNGLLLMGGRPAPATVGPNVPPAKAQGVLIPVMSTADLDALLLTGKPQVGCLLYDSGLQRLKYWDGNNAGDPGNRVWTTVTAV